jgi:signal transduction histidine kinase
MKFFKAFVALFLLFASGLYAGINDPVSKNGVLDLRQLNDSEFLFKLQGRWEFYWNKMLLPADFRVSGGIKPDYYGEVPSYWTDYPSDSVKTTPLGYATYRLRIMLPPGFRKSLGFDMPVFDSSYEIYVNGTLMASNGKPGKTGSESVPFYKRNFFRYNPDSDNIEVVINVSNFHHRRGGFWLPVKFGTFDAVQRRISLSWASDWGTVSFLLGFSLLFFFFYLFYTKDNLTAFFSLATTGLATRPLFTNNFLLNAIGADISWTWLIRFEYIGLYTILAGWYWFALNLYPSKPFRILTWIISVILVITFLLTLFLPVRIFGYATFIIYPLLVTLILYSMTSSIRGALRKNTIDIIYFATFLLLSLAAVHDVRLSLGRASVPSVYILTYTLVLFVFVQAVLLLYKWVRANMEKEELRKELEFMNRNLEIIVKDRTHEINARKEEIEVKNKKIEFQNKQLSDTIQLKNRIFSLIAHDLRSPVVNILYMLNLLKDEEYRDKYETFSNVSIQYAQQVINLLENMLVWGRGQEDKIKFAPDRHDLADIILTNLSIFKETADKKDIAVNFTQIGNSKAYFDKDLMDIIIRNLLSNAVKYTPRGGRISILLKDRSQTDELIILKVCDNGVGIPEDKQEFLFSREEMESTPGTENEKGTGIGLKLCSELVRINHGTISVDSRPGEGTCFTITLPEKKSGA